MKKSILILAICLCAALAAGFASGSPGMQGQGANATAAKSKPAPGPGPTSMYFSNRPGDKITNDGSGLYVDAVGGVVCKVTQDPGSDCTFLLNIQTTSHPKRYVDYDYRTIASTDCDPDGGATGTLSDTGFIIVQHVGDAPVGIPVARHANFYTNRLGNFIFTRPQNPSYHCSTSVLVYRLDPQHWYVSTDQTMGSPLPSNDGILAPVGDIAQQISGTGAFTGNYHMPFAMNIYCPGCK